MLLPARWNVSDVVLSPGPAGAFDETAVKDPTIVRDGDLWRVFYTAFGRGELSLGTVAASELEGLEHAPRHRLDVLATPGGYWCAPQVFFFRPHGLWYLVFQTADGGNYLPVFSTVRTLDDPSAWAAPRPLLAKDEAAKWIDFWTICDAIHAYLFYTRDHRDVMVWKTPLEEFPHGWGPAELAFEGVHEAVHVYKALGREEYHLFYEERDSARFFGAARAPSLAGPWTRATDRYAAGEMLSGADWTDMVSHGELLRIGIDERMEYDADHPEWLVQGLRRSEYVEPYARMPWRLGLIRHG